MYTTATTKNASMRTTSPIVGPIPRRNIPYATTTAITDPRANAIAPSPATNLPLITSSRWIGWATRRGKVRCERSPLMASKPKAMPSNGPRMAMNSWKAGTRSGANVKT